MQIVKKLFTTLFFLVPPYAFSVNENFLPFLLAAQLEQCLNTIHEEHLQEMKIVQQEAMKLHQPRSDMKKVKKRHKKFRGRVLLWRLQLHPRYKRLL